MMVSLYLVHVASPLSPGLTLALAGPWASPPYPPPASRWASGPESPLATSLLSRVSGGLISNLLYKSPHPPVSSHCFAH